MYLKMIIPFRIIEVWYQKSILELNEKMKKYDYVLALNVTFKVLIIFGSFIFIGCYLAAKRCDYEDCTFSFSSILHVPLLIQASILFSLLFFAMGVWRYLVRFHKHNNKIIILDNKIIVPGFLQILPEKKLDLRNAEKVEKEVVGKNANVVITIFFSDGSKPEKIFWSNFMTIEKFDELYVDLKKTVEK